MCDAKKKNKFLRLIYHYSKFRMQATSKSDVSFYNYYDLSNE